MPSFRASSWPREQTQVSCIAGRLFTVRATGEAPRFPYSWADCCPTCLPAPAPQLPLKSLCSPRVHHLLHLPLPYTLFPSPSIFPYDPGISNNSVFPLSTPISFCLLSICPTRCFSWSYSFMLKSLVHFEVVLYMAWVKCPSPFFWRWRVDCLRIMLRSILSLLDGLGTTVKNQVTTDVWVYFWTLKIVSLLIRQNHTVPIPVAL